MPEPKGKKRDPRRQLWGTPDPVFQYAEERWGPFDIDLAATPGNAKCDLFITPEQDALNPETLWAPNRSVRRGWLNPPWANVGPFAMRTVREVVTVAKLDLICLLVPSRTGQAWWREAVQRYGQIHFIEGRVKFDPPEGVTGKDGKKLQGGFEDAAYVIVERPLTLENIRRGWNRHLKEGW